ncbi:MAG: DUF5666 domain-containing protein [Pseudomonadota bacterium]
MRTRAKLLVLAISCMAAACSPAANIELARQDDPKPPEQPDQPDGDGGIGGTGLFGTVTALGSVMLNGLNVQIEPITSIRQDSMLEVGATLLIEARAGANGYVADRIAAYYPLVGPIDRVDSGGQALSVLGTSVEIGPEVRVYDEAGEAIDRQTLRPGDDVAISGIWRNRSVVATRIDRRPADASAAVSGLLREDVRGVRIGATTLDPSCCLNLEAGQYVGFEGAYLEDVFVPTSRNVGAQQLFSEGVRELVVEAYLARNPNDDGFHLSGFGIVMDPESPATPAVDDRSLFIGSYDGEFRIERSIILPSDQTARAAMLDQLDVESLLP